jgi:AraC family transcriptional regulator of adaptative response/methylated-DNA-[protein]-cysteine methyltransferase
MDALADPDAFESRYAAIARRDPAADGQFFYAVATTGVYCRPSCGARLARRENVSFHLTCAAAERAGFRPCRRCRPDEAPRAQRLAATMAEACRLIVTRIGQGEALPDLAQLAAHAEMSPFHFHRLFRQTIGVTPRAFAAAERARIVRARLSEAGATVTEAIQDAGYGSTSRFYETATSRLGMTPTEFRDGGNGQNIRFAVAECSLGPILVAATDKGICAIAFADTPEALVREVRDRFPHAHLVGADPAFDRTVAQVVAAVETPNLAQDLPLDVRGTAFQQRVWQALRDIPPGRTASYTDIARTIGEPRAIRAVAGACAANPAALVIPCHRVVRADGALAGYRWGIARKRTLLEREAGPEREARG